MEGNTPPKPSSSTVRKRNPALTNRSLHLDAEWCSRTYELDHTRTSDANGLEGQSKGRVLGRGIADGSIPDKSVALESKSLQVPQALWSGRKTTYKRLRIFGCEAYTFIPREKRTKLVPHLTKCIFLGYGTNGEFGYRLWDPENQKLIRSSDAVFNEDSILSNRSQQKISK